MIRDFIVLGVLNIILLTGGMGCNAVRQVNAIETEASYCSKDRSYSEPISTISGNARYQKRQTISAPPGGLGSVDPVTYPIRYAEVVVKTVGESIVQCGETDALGNFRLIVPQSHHVLILSVQSRALNRHLQASVMDSPQKNKVYNVSATILPNQDAVSGITLIAPATGLLTGGAFNILDELLKSNEFLRSHGACGTACKTFSDSAPKVSVYWTPGFNPNQYFGNATPGISFYLRGKRQIYILGGIGGDVNSSDTDHFDASVIEHEYGHFIEDTYSVSDSPGGTHSGNGPIDPRLAWSEGWANFFSSAAQKNSIYHDTIGNSDGNSMTPVVIRENLESGTKDTPTAGSSGEGEGNFREFSISRTLWDFIDSPGNLEFSDTDSDGVVGGSFNELWRTFTGSFSDPSLHFRHFGLFIQELQRQPSSTSVTSILTAEQQKGNQSDYATPNSGGSCSDSTIVAVRLPGDDGSFVRSNQFASNDFYTISHPGGNMTLNLSTPNPSHPADIDLYVYREGYNFGTTGDFVGSSDKFRCSDSSDETISTSVSAGTYLINVKVYTAPNLPAICGGGTNNIGSTSYRLTYNGSQVCP